ncbi:hypothetical protein [Bergeyella sp. RCAD1439]|uniref:hypothetical protein n=1 Tax=Bergeyella anatis TaxID=3113737 RepID=UPI002E16F51F|nr:hypothetical protein [Bergeyella sp. RCAD1439]
MTNLRYWFSGFFLAFWLVAYMILDAGQWTHFSFLLAVVFFMWGFVADYRKSRK